jgi:hypothetical protein
MAPLGSRAIRYESRPRGDVVDTAEALEPDSFRAINAFVYNYLGNLLQSHQGLFLESFFHIKKKLIFYMAYHQRNAGKEGR